MELTKEKTVSTLKTQAKRLRSVLDELKRQSPTFNQTLFSLKCAAIGFAFGLVFLRRVYVPTVFGLGYGIGRSAGHK